VTEAGPSKEVAPPPQPDWPSEFLLKVGGIAVACWGAVLLALVCAFLTPYRVGSVLVPVSVVLVVAGLITLIRFAHEVTGNVWLSLTPGAVWLLLSLVLSARTSEGDLVLIEQNWVATVYMLAGAVTIGVTAYRLFAPRRRRGL
jgi:hypothetical protein